MIDIFIIVVLIWALIAGWRNGFIKEIVSTIGFFVGLLIAASCYSAFGEYLAVNGSEANMITSVVAFVILWIIVPIVLGAAATMVTQIIKSTFIGKINSGFGALLSIIKFSVLLGCIFTVMSALNILDTSRTAESYLYQPMQTNFAAFMNSAFGTNLPGYSVEDEATNIQSQPFTPYGDSSSSSNKDVQSSDTTWVNLR